MVNGYKNLFKDYEKLLVKNDALSKENRSLKYSQTLLESQIKILRNTNQKIKEEIAQKQLEYQNELNQKDYEISRLKALLNMDGNNHGIPTSQTPIHKAKVIPNTREKTNLTRGGQNGHKKHKLEKFKDEEVTENIKHEMTDCPCCHSKAIEETGKIREKDELDYKLLVEKRRHTFIEYECKECGKIFSQEIPNNLKEENQYGPQVQALELTL